MTASQEDKAAEPSVERVIRVLDELVQEAYDAGLDARDGDPPPSKTAREQTQAMHEELRVSIRAITAEREGEKMDAARYRHLRSRDNSLETRQRDKGILLGPSCYHRTGDVWELKYEEELDEAIDTARAALAKEHSK